MTFPSVIPTGTQCFATVIESEVELVSVNTGWFPGAATESTVEFVSVNETAGWCRLEAPRESVVVCVSMIVAGVLRTETLSVVTLPSVICAGWQTANTGVRRQRASNASARKRKHTTGDREETLRLWTSDNHGLRRYSTGSVICLFWDSQTHLATAGSFERTVSYQINN